MSRAFDILDAFETILKAAAITSAPLIMKTRAYDLEKLPAIVLSIGGQNSESQNVGFIDESLTIEMKIFAQGIQADLDRKLMDLHAEAYAAIMASDRLGLAYIIDLEPISMNSPQVDGDGKKAIITANFSWAIRYRHARNSMTS